MVASTEKDHPACLEKLYEMYICSWNAKSGNECQKESEDYATCVGSAPKEKTLEEQFLESVANICKSIAADPDEGKTYDECVSEMKETNTSEKANYPECIDLFYEMNICSDKDPTGESCTSEFNAYSSCMSENYPSSDE